MGSSALIALDDKQLVERLAKKFRNRGWGAASVVDGLACVQSMTKSRFEILILGADIPKLRGVEVLTVIRKRATPVLLVADTLSRADEKRISGMEKVVVISADRLEARLWKHVGQFYPERVSEGGPAFDLGRLRSILASDLKKIASDPLDRALDIGEWDNYLVSSQEGELCIAVAKGASPEDLLEFPIGALEKQIRVMKRFGNEWVCVWPSIASVAA